MKTDRELLTDISNQIEAFLGPHCWQTLRVGGSLGIESKAMANMNLIARLRSQVSDSEIGLTTEDKVRLALAYDEVLTSFGSKDKNIHDHAGLIIEESKKNTLIIPGATNGLIGSSRDSGGAAQSISSSKRLWPDSRKCLICVFRKIGEALLVEDSLLGGVVVSIAVFVATAASGWEIEACFFSGFLGFFAGKYWMFVIAFAALIACVFLALGLLTWIYYAVRP